MTFTIIKQSLHLISFDQFTTFTKQPRNMVLRYLKVFKKNIFLIIVIITLIIVSSVTKGKTATITSTLAGIAMIYGGITFIMWIIRTPTKKDEGV